MTKLEKLKAAADAAAHDYTAASDAADVAWNTYAAAYNAWLAESNITRGWLKLRNTRGSKT
jgi:hypothetical protein